ncbi:MAG: 3-hydroxylacyl-ACP dehydratase [Burkholderiales bacterium]|nr:3-hydroxylacyl-ACP dehydratase [Burkholderiales bacterium]
MRVALNCPIVPLLPQTGRMCLLETAVEGDEASFVAETTIRDDNLFQDGAGVGAWVGIEFMAQCVAAWAGWRAQLQGAAPPVGFLLGTRAYQCSRPLFLTGETLRIEAVCDYRADNGLGKFDCTIAIAGEMVASASLTVFEPADAAAYVKDSSHV